MQVLCARYPENSSEFEVTRFLIKQRANLFLKDSSGLTIFDHANAILTRESTSYRRDLWYCALQREGMDTNTSVEVPPRIAKYNKYYTPEHYRALCHLDHWTEKDLSRQLRDILEAYPWSEEKISEFSRICDELEADPGRIKERRMYVFWRPIEGPSRRRRRTIDLGEEK